MKQFFRYNRAAAAVILAVIVLASLALGVTRSVHRLTDRVIAEYGGGDDEYGSVQADLTKYCQHGRELCAIAEAAGFDTAALSDALAVLEQSPGPFDGAKTGADAVQYAAASVYNRMLAAGIDETMMRSAKLYYTEAESDRMRMANNEAYNDLARSYNDAIRSFPASLVSDGKTADVFDGAAVPVF